jgi:hypothetical protein
MSHHNARLAEIPADEGAGRAPAIDRDADAPASPRFGAALSVLWWDETGPTDDRPSSCE